MDPSHAVALWPHVAIQLVSDVRFVLLRLVRLSLIGFFQPAKVSFSTNQRMTTADSVMMFLSAAFYQMVWF